MDSVKIDHVKRILGHQQFHFSIVDNYISKIESGELKDIDQEMLFFLKREVDNQKKLLEDLGIKFTDTGLLKQYSENLQDLESKMAKIENVSFQGISAFIRDNQKKYINLLKDKYGLCTLINIKGSSVFEFEIYSLKVLTEDNQFYSLNNCKDSSELEFLKKRIENAKIKSLPLFDYNDEGLLFLNEKNYNSLNTVITLEFGELGNISKLNYNSYFEKNNNEFLFTKIKFNLSPLKTQKLIEESIKNY